jgi:hypothetical protein
LLEDYFEERECNRKACSLNSSSRSLASFRYSLWPLERSKGSKKEAAISIFVS